MLKLEITQVPSCYSLLDQFQILVMVCVYLSPLSCGFSSSLMSLKQRENRAPGGAPDWTDHLVLLGGLISSATILPLFLRALGRTKSAAAVSVILFVATILTMFSERLWMTRMAEFCVGLALGLHLPTQQLLLAESVLPQKR